MTPAPKKASAKKSPVDGGSEQRTASSIVLSRRVTQSTKPSQAAMRRERYREEKVRA